MKDAIRWLVLLIVAAIAGGGLYYQYQNTRPCVHPIGYSVGVVDTRFGITKFTIINNAKAASDIWNNAAGKTVIVYDPNAKMKINFVYDERQANAKIGSQIAIQQENIDSARASLEFSQEQYTSKQDAYNQSVNAVNSRGGATRSEAITLNAERDSLNALADSINRQVVAFNASVTMLNAKVAEYNKTAGHVFKEGEYVRDSSGERINVFEFVGATQLKRVLAHEFGHAIGLDHNEDPKSIMFAKNESGNLVSTKTDIAALKSLCGT